MKPITSREADILVYISSSEIEASMQEWALSLFKENTQARDIAYAILYPDKRTHSEASMWAASDFQRWAKQMKVKKPFSFEIRESVSKGLDELTIRKVLEELCLNSLTFLT